MRPADEAGGGGSGLDSSEQALADAIADQMQDESDSVVTAEEAQCYGEGVVASLGMDRLVQLGLGLAAVQSGTGPGDVELAEGDIDGLVDPLLECVDMAAVFASGFTEGDEAISEDSAQCVADGLTEEAIKSAARSGITGQEFDVRENQELLSQMFDLMLECLTDEELEMVFGP